MIKGDQPQLKAALEAYLRLVRPQGMESPADWCQVEKGHGRLEERALWIVPCEPDMQAYLEEAFGWPEVQWCGWIRRRRTQLASGKEQSQALIWIAGAAFPWSLTAAQAAAHLREHWQVENGVFYVRDVTMDEDRLHGRKIGYGLSSIRNAALTFLRRMIDAPFIPDARRRLAARDDLGLPWLHF